MSEESKQEISGNKSKFYSLAIIGIFLFVAGAVLSGIFIKEQPQVLGLSAQTEVTSLVATIGKLIELPSEETPVAITITNPNKLKDQPFFKNAKKNDKLLIYKEARWAVLYRPTKNKIIEVGAFDTAQLTVTPTVPVTPTATITPTPTPNTSGTPTPTLTPTASPTVTPAED